MIYKIIYFQRETQIGSSLWDGADPESFAAVGIIRHRAATHAIILDGAGKEIGIVHAKGPNGQKRPADVVRNFFAKICCCDSEATLQHSSTFQELRC